MVTRHFLLSQTAQIIYWFALFILLVYITPGISGLKLLPPLNEIVNRWKKGESKQTVERQAIDQATLKIESDMTKALTLLAPDLPKPKTLNPHAEPKPIPGQKADSAEKARLVKSLQTAKSTPVIQPIEDTCVQSTAGKCTRLSMNYFYQALQATAKKTQGALTRIGHFGDSLITADTITATVREQLQNRFGDAGHGFMYIAKPWHWYSHQGVFHQAGEGWKINRITFPTIADQLYGYGGVTFQSYPGGWAIFGTAREGKWGRRVSQFDLYYLKHPNGADIEVQVNPARKQKISTQAPEVSADFAQIPVENGGNTLKITVAGKGIARLFGVTLETDTAGVVYDSIGIQGGFSYKLLNINAAHWQEQLKHRNLNLIIINYGTNESEFKESYPKAWYEKQFKQVLDRIRRAIPKAACLVIGPIDRADSQSLETMPVIPKLVKSQRLVAHQCGCAFWDAYIAMGGQGTIKKWYSLKPGRVSSDLTHPNMLGFQIIGNLFYGALMDGFVKYLVR